MGTIGVLNTLSFLLILTTGIILLYKLVVTNRKDGSLILIIISFSILVLVTLTNVIEHLGITDYFDLFEDELGIIFIPLFIFAVFSYCLKKELVSNQKNQQYLNEAHQQLKISVKSANQALWEWHPESKQIIINKNFCFLDFELLLYEIDSQNSEQIVHPDSADSFKCLYDGLLNNSQITEDIELQLKTFYGNYKWVMICGTQVPISFKNQNITFLGTLIDITNFKKIQFELEEAKNKAEESERLKTAFLNNISHEIRTPMNAIIGFSDLIIEPGIAPDKQKRFVNMILQGCDRLINTIDDLIEMSQIIASSVRISNKTINAKDFFSDFHKKYLSKALSKNITLDLNCDSTIEFTSDELKLKKILGYLVDNAIKFTNRGGITYGYNKENNDLHFYVKDSGIGIDKKNQETVFGYFRQIETSLSTFHSGAGLGLSICKGLINAMGGKIWINSEVGVGTEVHFIIPTSAHQENDGKTNQSHKKKLSNSTSKILIAEDEESNYYFLKEILSSKFETILWAQTGKQAVDIFQSNNDISIILMDLKIPVMDGCEAAIEIKKINPDVTIIAQSAYVLPISIENAEQSIFNGFISKPINRDVLYKTINQYFINVH